MESGFARDLVGFERESGSGIERTRVLFVYGVCGGDDDGGRVEVVAWTLGCLRGETCWFYSCVMSISYRFTALKGAHLSAWQDLGVQGDGLLSIVTSQIYE